MQHWSTESSEQLYTSSNPRTNPQSPQDGSRRHRQPHGSARSGSPGSHSSASPHSVPGSRRDSAEGINAGQLDERLRRLSVSSGRSESRRAVAGQRILDYENALVPTTPRQALGFKVIKRLDPASVAGTQLSEFPNEILTHILSHLHPDSHAAVALVSKRFYALVTTPHAWRMAFLRYFPGHDSLLVKAASSQDNPWEHEAAEAFRSEVRYFTRLTPLGTWRSEYLLRTRLLRGLARGKPSAGSGGIGSSTRSSKKVSAVLTYNSKLPWAVTSIHAIFSNGKKPPRAIHGAGDLGVATLSDPTVGRVEKWGFEDPFSALQLDEVFPNLEPYGLGEGPAACPNVIDVSQTYGMVAGEGFPGGRAYYRPINELRGRHLGQDTGVVDTYPDIPKIPELSEAISSVWIAKSSAVPATTNAMAGIVTGSTLGVVTFYCLGWDTNGPRFSSGDMTARWVLSPGVPIVSIKIDDSYSPKRRGQNRIWAVALNALGEVFYLTAVPNSTLNRAKGEDMTKNAWHAGRSVYWQLLEHTRRQARPDELDKNATRGAYSPRSPSDAMELSKDQLAAEAREIEKYMRHKPAHFRKVCDGWDMRRKLEVDFAGEATDGAGEAIVVIACGADKGQGPLITRFTRSLVPVTPVLAAGTPNSITVGQSESPPAVSIFGAARKDQPLSRPLDTVATRSSAALSHGETRKTPTSTSANPLHEWQRSNLVFRGHNPLEITASALDVSGQATVTLSEDPLVAAHPSGTTPVMTPRTTESMAEVPGRRARFVAVGTKNGTIFVWDTRGQPTSVDGDVDPVRVIQTESPEISCLAVTSLYLVHGGSDGLVQAWDPLASALEPVRTLNARSSGRVPRHMLTMNPALRSENYAAARAIFLDPDPTVLRGIVAFGAFLRYWSYSATALPPGRKRRLRHSDIHGRLASRRQGGTVSGYIAAEAAELRREQEYLGRQQERLRNRFGVGAFGDLTEEEAIRYAQMISEESYLLDEQRRASASDTGSAAEASMDTASSTGESTVDTITPEPSVSGRSPSGLSSAAPLADEESEYEMQIQQAIRLSLLEGVNDLGQSPRGNSSGDYEFPITYKAKSSGKKGKSRSSASSPSPSHTPLVGNRAGSSSKPKPASQEDDDLALAMRLSLEEQAGMPSSPDAAAFVGLGIEGEQFPALGSEVKGKKKL